MEAARIRDAEDEIFRRLHAAVGENLVRDGVVDADQYVESDLRTLLILKEVNDPGGGGWDLRHFLSKGGRSQSWNNVARWVRAIQCLPDDLDWSVLEPVGADDRKDLLSKIAVMNLKKIPGGAVSNGGQIYSAASKIRQLLQDQFNIYAPDLVICCGTAGIAEALVFEGQSLHWQKTGRGVSYCRLPRRGYSSISRIQRPDAPAIF